MQPVSEMVPEDACARHTEVRTRHFLVTSLRAGTDRQLFQRPLVGPGSDIQIAGDHIPATSDSQCPGATTCFSKREIHAASAAGAVMTAVCAASATGPVAEAATGDEGPVDLTDPIVADHRNTHKEPMTCTIVRNGSAIRTGECFQPESNPRNSAR